MNQTITREPQPGADDDESAPANNTTQEAPNQDPAAEGEGDGVAVKAVIVISDDGSDDSSDSESLPPWPMPRARSRSLSSPGSPIPVSTDKGKGKRARSVSLSPPILRPSTEWEIRSSPEITIETTPSSIAIGRILETPSESIVLGSSDKKSPSSTKGGMFTRTSYQPRSANSRQPVQKIVANKMVALTLPKPKKKSKFNPALARMSEDPFTSGGLETAGGIARKSFIEHMFGAHMVRTRPPQELFPNQSNEEMRGRILSFYHSIVNKKCPALVPGSKGSLVPCPGLKGISMSNANGRLFVGCRAFSLGGETANHARFFFPPEFPVGHFCVSRMPWNHQGPTGPVKRLSKLVPISIPARDKVEEVKRRASDLEVMKHESFKLWFGRPLEG